jgi:hypothetical protein
MRVRQSAFMPLDYGPLGAIRDLLSLPDVCCVGTPGCLQLPRFQAHASWHFCHENLPGTFVRPFSSLPYRGREHLLSDRRRVQGQAASRPTFSKFITISLFLVVGSPLIADLSDLLVWLCTGASIAAFLGVTLSRYRLDWLRERLLQIWCLPFRQVFKKVGVVMPSAKAYPPTVLLSCIEPFVAAADNYVMLASTGFIVSHHSYEW